MARNPGSATGHTYSSNQYIKMKNIPTDVEEEILVRLPIKSVFRFKSVCKRWYSLIEEPAFVTRYNDHAKCRSKLVCYSEYPITNTFASISSPSEYTDDHDNIRTTTIIEDLKLPPFIDINEWVLEGVDWNRYFPDDDEMEEFDVHILGPVNGIYCIYHRVLDRCGGILILWNPGTRSYKHILPPICFPFPLKNQYGFCGQHHDTCVPLGFHIGFGYDDKLINDYKVVVICHWDMSYAGCGDELWHVRVYNNATNEWTTICCLRHYPGQVGRPFPYIVSSKPEFSNCFLNGSCHWLCGIREREQGLKGISHFGVLAFDMVQHTFKVMRGPPLTLDNVHRKSIVPSVWAVQETIVVVANYTKVVEKVVVWIMREYGVDDSWNLVLSIPNVDNEFYVVGISNDERIFLGDKNGGLISYCFRDDKLVVEDGVHMKPFGSIPGTLGMFNYEESLAPIKPTNHIPTLLPIKSLLRCHTFSVESLQRNSTTYKISEEEGLFH